MTLPGDPLTSPLQSVVGEVEGHVAEAGWDQPPQLWVLASTEQLLRDQPQLASAMGLVAADPASLTAVPQESLPDGPLDEVLGSILFGEEVLGVVLAHEVLVLPPAAEQAVADVEDPAAAAAEHPERRDVRMVVGVTRDGGQACVLRLRGVTPEQDERVTGADLAPALSAALRGTLEE